MLQLGPSGQFGPEREKTRRFSVPDDNRSNRGNRDDNESRQSPGRDSNPGGSKTSDRERDEKGRFESDSEMGGSSSRGGSSGGSSKKK
jgi:hypothetical protein